MSMNLPHFAWIGRKSMRNGSDPGIDADAMLAYYDCQRKLRDSAKARPIVVFRRREGTGRPRCWSRSPAKYTGVPPEGKSRQGAVEDAGRAVGGSETLSWRRPAAAIPRKPRTDPRPAA